MKIIVSFVLILNVLSNIYGQNVDVHFSTYTPRWYNVIEDTNFVLGSFTPINSFSSNFPQFNPSVESEYSYVPFSCWNGDYMSDGSILVCVRNSDGQIMWDKYMNTSNGDDQNFYTSFYVDDKIYYAGKKRTQHSYDINETWQLGGFSKPFYRVIDKKSGNLDNEAFDVSDTIGSKNNFILKPLMPINNQMKEVNRVLQGEGIFISDLNESTLLPIKSQFLPYPTPLSLGNVKTRRSLFIREDDQKSIVYYQAISKDTTLEGHIGNLDFYQIENDSFILARKVDFSRYVKMVPDSPTQNRVFYDFSKSGSFVLTQTYQQNEYPYYKTWMLKLNSKGDEEYHIGDIKLKDLNHSYEFAVPFYVDNNHVFLLTLPSYTGEQGMDIVEVTGTGEVKLLGHLTTGSDFRVQVGGIKMNLNGDIIFSLKWDQDYSVIMGMHISDFGIKLSSDDNSLEIPNLLFKVSPNPTSDHITLAVSNENFSKGVVSIKDLAGKIVYSDTYLVGEKIDIQNLGSGIYIVHFSPESRPDYFLTTKLIKL